GIRRALACAQCRTARARRKRACHCHRGIAAAGAARRGGTVMMLPGLWSVVLLLLFLAFASFKVLREYERGVVFFLGRFQSVKGPGLIIIIPMIQQMVRV